MKASIIAFLIICYSLPASSQHRYKQNLKDVATIIFPDTPQIHVEGLDTIYTLPTRSGVIYMGAATEAQKSLKELLNKNALDSIYNQVMQGTIESLKGKVFYRKNIKVNNLTGVEFGYKGVIKDNTYYGYNQIFYFNNTIVDYGVLVPDSVNHKLLTTDFFGSFKLTIAEDDVRQSNTEEAFFKFGYFLGFAIILLFIGLIGLGIVFLIKRFTR